MLNASDVYFFYVGDCGPFYFVECRIAYWLWRTVPFILLGIGTFGNILNICILSRQQLRRFSTGVYLLTLAISELTFLWTGLLQDTIYSITTFRLMDQSEIFCRTRLWFALTSGSFSIWVLVILTVERVLLTKVPVFSRRKLTPRNAAISAVAALLIVAILNSHVIFGFTLSAATKTSEDIQINKTEKSLVQTNLPCDFASKEYRIFYEQTWSILMFVLYTFLPALIIFTGNINIALAILFRRKRLARVAPVNLATQIIEDRRKSSAKILFILSFIFLFTTMPYCIYFVVRGQAKEISERNVARWQLVTVIVNILGWCNFTFNFFLYFVSGSLFKQEWQKLVSKTKRRVLWIVTDR